jgi:hypothetical protein
MNKPLLYIDNKIKDYKNWIRVAYIKDAFEGRKIAEKHGIGSVEFDRAMYEHQDKVRRLEVQMEMLLWLDTLIKEARNLE